MTQADQIAAALQRIRQGDPSTDPKNVICYVPGTLVEQPKGDLINGETLCMLRIHPDGTPDGTRKWVRTRGELARWALTSGDLAQGARIVAVGHPASAPGKSIRDNNETWIVDAQRITVDLWHQGL